jgi:cytochrome bd-type quinol oxidase subunit 1
MTQGAGLVTLGGADLVQPALHLLGLTISVPSFPGIGNTWVVAALFFAHIVIAEFTLGAVTLGVGMEAYALRSGRPFAWRYAQRAVSVYYLLFSLGATFAVFVVVLLIALWATEWGTLINILLPVIGLAFGLFLVLVPQLVIYRNSFGRMRPGLHLALGISVVVWQTLFMFLIVGLDSYLITPPPGQTGFGIFLNPSYLPLVGHRLVGNVSWTALFLAGFATLMARRTADPAEHEFQFWAARVNLRIGLLTALLMPLDGFFLVLVIRYNQLGYFDNLVGTYGTYMVVQEALLGAILVGGNIALTGENGGLRSSALGQVATAVVFAGMVVACLPSAVIGPDILALRYAGLACAVIVTALHLAVRWRPRGLLTQVVLGPMLRRSLVLVGVVSMATALYMGYIKEQARGTYAVYGVLQQSDAGGRFNAPGNLYP